MDVCVASFEFLNSNRILKIQIKWWDYIHLKSLRFIFILCVEVFCLHDLLCLHVCVCTMRLPCTHGNQKKASNSQELELQEL